MGHLGAQPHCKALTSQEVGRCYPGADMARRSLLLLPTTCTHLYSPSGLKVPGVPRGQRDPREKCQGQGIRVRVIHLGSEININKAWLISGDQHLSNPHEPVLCHSPGHLVVQGLHGHPVGERKSLIRGSQTHPTRKIAVLPIVGVGHRMGA